MPDSDTIDPTEEQITRFQRTLWLPVWFTAFLCAITLIGNLLGPSAGAEMTAFLCFLPLAVWWICAAQSGLSRRLQVIERRLRDAGNHGLS